uniref:Uncharacterized protein n=1 Tax=Romanomermis culicivorax TaxID=13658 RepID=A0A915JZ55_ROMCU
MANAVQSAMQFAWVRTAPLGRPVVPLRIQWYGPPPPTPFSWAASGADATATGRRKPKHSPLRETRDPRRKFWYKVRASSNKYGMRSPSLTVSNIKAHVNFERLIFKIDQRFDLMIAPRPDRILILGRIINSGCSQTHGSYSSDQRPDVLSGNRLFHKVGAAKNDGKNE